MSEPLILHCEDSLEGIFTAIYDAFVYKKQLQTPYTDSIEIVFGENANYSLFAREIEITTDLNKVQKTVTTIQNRLGYMVYSSLLSALCHYDENRATVVLGYLVRAFAKGESLTGHLSDPYVLRVMELTRKVGNEKEKFCGFLRFRVVPLGEDLPGLREYFSSGEEKREVLFARVEPKCNLIPLLLDHFTDRYPGEHFIIYDPKRKLAVVHEAYHRSVLVSGEELSLSGQGKDEFEELWKQYFRTMEIQQRHNPKCQRNLMPLWYRENLVEI